MKMKKTMVWVSTICLAMVIIGLLLVPVVKKIGNNEWINLISNFSVEIENQSNYDIASVETGIRTSSSSGEIIEGQSTDIYEQTIKSGETVTITPILSLSGKEGGIYLKYMDSTGDTVTKGICSYTVTLSGRSKVIISNSNIVVEENCS